VSRKNVALPYIPNGNPLTPFSVEAYGRLGKPSVDLIGHFGAEAAGSGAVSNSAFVRLAVREHPSPWCAAWRHMCHLDARKHRTHAKTVMAQCKQQRMMEKSMLPNEATNTQQLRDGVG
jgi:hypothetical protein